MFEIFDILEVAAHLGVEVHGNIDNWLRKWGQTTIDRAEEAGLISRSEARRLRRALRVFLEEEAIVPFTRRWPRAGKGRFVKTRLHRTTRREVRELLRRAALGDEEAAEEALFHENLRWASEARRKGW